MIVRIASEGQYRFPEGFLPILNELDNALVEAAAQGDALRFKHLFEFMLRLVRGQGEPVPVDELVPSHIALPAPDITFEEARELFREEGLIPG
jgi:hypothetical protein